jgi:DNA-binding MarR family transcriptional regulator
MASKQLPIGYYLKKADNLLTRAIDKIQASSHLTRTGWQVLHAIHEEGQLEEATLAILMRPFATGDILQTLLTELRKAGLIETKAGALVLTESGIKRHEASFTRQQEFRQRLMSGISRQEYEQAVQTLQKLIDNLQGL